VEFEGSGSVHQQLLAGHSYSPDETLTAGGVWGLRVGAPAAPSKALLFTWWDTDCGHNAPHHRQTEDIDGTSRPES